MAIPHLDPRTGYLPYQGPEPYWADLTEVRSAFAVSEHRAHLWHMFEHWIDALDAAGFSGDLLIGGSYVTEKRVPSDLDVALAVQPDRMSEVRAKIKAHATLWTWQGVQALNFEEVHRPITDRLQPLLGCVDAHPLSVGTARGALLVEDWTNECDGDGVPTGVRKGWLGVRRRA